MYDAVTPGRLFSVLLLQRGSAGRAACQTDHLRQDILAKVPDYWAHYEEQAASSQPELDPRRSRGGIHELELAIDVLDAVFNNRREVWPVNVPGRGAIPDFPEDLVVEVPGYVDQHGIQYSQSHRDTCLAIWWVC
jgi:alpha-galactosidase/6-phospho-beta-glucosidase family protein